MYQRAFQKYHECISVKWVDASLKFCPINFRGKKEEILVVQRATRPLNLVAQYPFLVVPGVRTPDLSSTAGFFL